MDYILFYMQRCIYLNIYKLRI